MTLVQETQTKEWTNIDFTNTSAYRTLKAFNKEGIYHEHGSAESGGIPRDEFRQLKRLRKLDSIVKPNKGPILKIITSMARQIIRQTDNTGRPISKEYLTIGGQFRGIDFADMEVGQSFIEGWNKKPIMGKVYHSGMRWNPETGEDLGKIEVKRTIYEYFLEVPKDLKQRKKFIDSLIENSNGTFSENIQYYYKELGSGNAPIGAKRDGTFSHEQFTDLSIEEMRELSNKGAGSKGLGYYRDKDDILRNRDGSPVNPK